MSTKIKNWLKEHTGEICLTISATLIGGAAGYLLKTKRVTKEPDDIMNIVSRTINERVNKRYKGKNVITLALSAGPNETGYMLKDLGVVGEHLLDGCDEDAIISNFTEFILIGENLNNSK